MEECTKRNGKKKREIYWWSYKANGRSIHCYHGRICIFRLEEGLNQLVDQYFNELFISQSMNQLSLNFIQLIILVLVYFGEKNLIFVIRSLIIEFFP